MKSQLPYKILIIKQNQDLENLDIFFNVNLFKNVFCIDQNVLAEALKYEDLLITSQNGVFSLIENLNHFKIYQNHIRNKRIFTVGLKTYEALLNHGFKKVESATNNIKSLIALDKFNKANILYLSGYHTAFNDYKDFGVQRLIIYKSISITLNRTVFDKIKNQEISHIFLYSKRSAEVFLQNFPLRFNFQMVNFICISENVLKAIKAHNPNSNVLYPEIPTEKEMFKLIQKEHLIS